MFFEHFQKLNQVHFQNRFQNHFILSQNSSLTFGAFNLFTAEA